MRIGRCSVRQSVSTVLFAKFSWQGEAILTWRHLPLSSDERFVAPGVLTEAGKTFPAVCTVPRKGSMILTVSARFLGLCMLPGVQDGLWRFCRPFQTCVRQEETVGLSCFAVGLK